MRRYQSVLGACALAVMVVAGAACTGGPGPLVDHEPPDILTESVTVTAPDADGVRVELNQISTDDIDGDAFAPVFCDTPAGKYPIGDTTVECHSTDRAGNTSFKSVVVTVTPPTGDAAVEVDVASANACARLSSGSIRCWGDGRHGKLGNASTAYAPFPVTVSGITTATQVSMVDGTGPVCALLADRTVWCWGPNVPQPDGSRAQRNTPVPLPGFTDVVQMDGSCGVFADGTVKCWTVVDPGAPTTMAGLNDVVSLGGRCAVIAGGTARCWGENTHGELGNGTTALVGNFPPTDVSVLTGVTGIDSGTANCAVLADTTVWCWGNGQGGTLGNGTLEISQPLPEQVGALTGATSVAVGVHRACALRFDGTGLCWGSNQSGELGDGTRAPIPQRYTVQTSAVPTPTPLKGVTNAVGMSLSQAFGCLVNDDGTVRCWGVGEAIGDGSDSLFALSPVTVSHLN